MAESATQAAKAVPSLLQTTQTQPPSTTNKQAGTIAETDISAKLRGPGTTFRAKIIGIDDVPEPRGDKMCQDSMNKLKENVKVSGQHKQKIVINISLSGIKLIDLMTAQVLHQHPVDRISFIARDLSDRRAFGYIYGDDNGDHHFYALKTAKLAEQVVLVLRDLFQYVYKLNDKTAAEEKNLQNQNQSQQLPLSEPPLVQATKNEDMLGLTKQFANMDGLNSTSPVTPTANDNDMFGMENLSDISSLSSEFSLASATAATNDMVKSNDTNKSNFRRSSSQKSAASWNGTSSQSNFAQKRYASLSIGHAKELKMSLPKYNQAEESHALSRKNADALAAVLTNEQNLDNVDKTSINTHSSPEISNSPGHVAAPIDSDNCSFFDEVMAATGISTTPVPSGVNFDDTPKTISKSSNKDFSGSMSSISSSSSKASSGHKSLSIGNLFFSKSDKNKSSLKRKNKTSRQSSFSSVVSQSEKTITNNSDNISDGKTVSVSEVDKSNTTSAGIPSIETFEVDRTTNSLDEGSSQIHQSSKEAVAKPRSVRIRPSAAVARARPRAAIPQTTNNDSKNPPMFKTKSFSENKTAINRSDNSPVSISPIDNSKITKNETTSMSQVKDPDPNEAWASFDKLDRGITDPAKTDIPFTESPWNVFPKTESNTPDDVWNALNKPDKFSSPNVLQEKATKDFSDNPFSSDSFSEDTKAHIASRLKRLSTGDEHWNAFETSPEVQEGSLIDEKVFTIDPFSTNADASLVQSEFESCDPFDNIAFNNVPEEDPFQNVEAVFGPQRTPGTPQVNNNVDHVTVTPEKDVTLSQENLDVSSNSVDDSFSGFEPFSIDKSDDSEKINPDQQYLSRSSKNSMSLQKENTNNLENPFDDVEFEKAFENMYSNSATETSNLENIFEAFNQTNSKQPIVPQSKFDFESVFDDQGPLNPEINAIVVSKQADNLAYSVGLNLSRSSSACSHSSSCHSSSSRISVKKLSSSEHVDDKNNSITKFAFDENTDRKPSVTTTFENSLANNFEFEFEFNNVTPSFVSSSPPPLPPRRPKSSTPSNKNESVSNPPVPILPPPPSKRQSSSSSLSILPPLTPPPPVPSRPCQLPKIIDDRISSASEDEESRYALPPSFEPPQLPQHLLSENLYGNFESFDVDFNESNPSTSERNNISVFNNQLSDKKMCDIPTSQPPKIPKRNFSTRTSSISSIDNSANYSEISKNESHSDDLAGFNREALQPHIDGGAKLTKDQILAGFVQGMSSPGMFQQQHQQIQNPFFSSQPNIAMGIPQQSPFGAPAAALFGSPLNSSPQLQISMSGMFPNGPRPAVPARSGAMRPPMAIPSLPVQSPFGDVQKQSGSLLSPTNLQPEGANSSASQNEKAQHDPFASLLPGMGAADKNDMFKNFTMAKPASKPNGMGSLGNVQNPAGAQHTPSNIANDPFGTLNLGDTFNFQTQEQPNNMDSLFG